MSEIIKIKALKYGEIPHYEWDTALIEHNPEYLLVKGEANRKLIHHGRGATFTCENPSIEFFPFNEWFTVSVEKVSNNQLNYYCNISMPSRFTNNVITFIDLDIDLVRRHNNDWCVIDKDEFIENSQKYCYPSELADKVIEEERHLIQKINNCQFPFNSWLDELITTFL